MSENEMVYDLGEIAVEPSRPVGTTATADRRRATTHGTAKERTGRPPTEFTSTDSRLTASLSLFVPGLGQLLSGNTAWGLLFLAGIGFCGALLRAIVLTSDRLVGTLSLLGIGADAIALSVIVLFLTAAVLHVVNVLHAARLGVLRGSHLAPHPVAAGVASLLVPGWGQLLHGHGVRGAFFLASDWLTAGAWIAFWTEAHGAVSLSGVSFPVRLPESVLPFVLVTAPAVLWTLAVYDAVAGAVAERRRNA